MPDSSSAREATSGAVHIDVAAVLAASSGLPPKPSRGSCECSHGHRPRTALRDTWGLEVQLKELRVPGLAHYAGRTNGGRVRNGTLNRSRRESDRAQKPAYHATGGPSCPTITAVSVP